tara:strand:- start:136 stop:324 length:189 start_codon:yes stop_codon:yes gene_type:complete
MEKVKLFGNTKVILGDLSKIKGGEVINSLDENKFNAVSVQNQILHSKISIIENNKFVRKRKK